MNIQDVSNRIELAQKQLQWSRELYIVYTTECGHLYQSFCYGHLQTY